MSQYKSNGINSRISPFAKQLPPSFFPVINYSTMDITSIVYCCAESKLSSNFQKMINEQGNDVTFILFEWVGIQFADVPVLFEDAISFDRVEANRSREIYRQDEAKLFVIFTFAGEHESPDVRTRRYVTAAVSSPRTRKIYDYTRFKNDRQFIFLLFCGVSRKIRDFFFDSPLLLAREFRL